MGAVGQSISSSIDAQTHNNVIEDVISYVKPGQVRSVADLLKTIFRKVDLMDLNKTQICRFLPYFFVDKTGRFLS